MSIALTLLALSVVANLVLVAFLVNVLRTLPEEKQVQLKADTRFVKPSQDGDASYTLTVDKLQVRMASFESCLTVQASPGNWDYSEYMQGMLNGMIFSYAVITGLDAKYADPPVEYIRNKAKPSDTETTSQ